MQFIYKYRKKAKEQNGVTLVELLAAIMVLTIVVLSFISFFLQAAKTNRSTNEINEATFVAQEEMERITHFSIANKALDELIAELGFNAEKVRSYQSDNGYSVSTALNAVSGDSRLVKVIVTVSEGGEIRAKMEAQLPFAENDP